LLNVPEGVPISVWSDGGLRNYGSLIALESLGKGLNRTLKMEFFASYHGHSRCDAHFGQGKMALRKAFPLGGPDSIEKVQNVFGKLKNSTTKLLEKDDIAQVNDEGNWDLGKWGLRGLGVKWWHIFSIPPTGSIGATRFVSFTHPEDPLDNNPYYSDVENAKPEQERRKRFQPLTDFQHMPIPRKKVQEASIPTDLKELTDLGDNMPNQDHCAKETAPESASGEESALGSSELAEPDWLDLLDADIIHELTLICGLVLPT